MLLLYSVAAGLLIGRLAGGQVRALELVHLRWWGLALGGLTVQLVLFNDVVGPRVGALGPILYVGSTIAVLVALLCNRSLPGFPVICLGAALNLAVVLANGGFMPSSLEARLALNGTADLGGRFTNSVLADGHTLLPWLGDIFVLPRPIPLANVFSIGDVLVAVGAVVFLVRAMRQPGTAPSGALRDA